MGRGGEVMATRSHILSSPTDPALLKHITDHFGCAIRFAATVIRFKNASALVASIYWWDSEGLSDRGSRRPGFGKTGVRFLEPCGMVGVGAYSPLVS